METITAPERHPNLREVILDTESTGLDVEATDRIIEIGCVEIMDGMPTGRELHLYFNPQRTIPAAITKIHGLTTEMLADKPLFKERAREILDFIQDAKVVAHNAEFDRRLINAELARASLKQFSKDQYIDSADLARRTHPGSPVSLDALCRRYEIDNSHRETHGALVDARLLAQVYLELIGGRQRALVLDAETKGEGPIDVQTLLERAKTGPQRPSRVVEPTPEENAQHEAFLKSVANPIWLTP